MVAQEVLGTFGQFSFEEEVLFEKHVKLKKVRKGEIVLGAQTICQSVYFILAGAFIQSRSEDSFEPIIDLHLPNEWMFNQRSLVEQTPSETIIRAFSKSEVIELSLSSIHIL